MKSLWAIIPISILLSGCASHDFFKHFPQSEPERNETHTKVDTAPACQCTQITPKAPAAFAQSYQLDNGYSVTVEEGRLEPRSIGTMTVKLYRDLTVGDFVSAFTLAREGTVTEVAVEPSDFYDNKVVITTETAGSGNYVEKQSVCIQRNTIKICLND